ncbi:MAG: carboxypeptidase regulatory-like domain-containing protein [Chitinophagales bacterium]
MKKFVFLLLPMFVILFSCNSPKPESETASTTDSTAANSAPQAPTGQTDTVTNENGTSSLPAQVFEESTGKPIEAAKIDAVENGRTAASATTDLKGGYSYTNLQVGHTYTFKVNKTGFGSMEKSATYDGTNSLPAFGLVAVKK